MGDLCGAGVVSKRRHPPFAFARSFFSAWRRATLSFLDSQGLDFVSMVGGLTTSILANIITYLDLWTWLAL
jgi:hypothetical protein